MGQTSEVTIDDSVTGFTVMKLVVQHMVLSRDASSHEEYRGTDSVRDTTNRQPYQHHRVSSSTVQPCIFDHLRLCCVVLRCERAETRMMGRPRSAYDWEGKKDVLFDLYITQNKSMDEVLAMQHDAALPRYGEYSTASQKDLRMQLLVKSPRHLLTSTANAPFRNAFENGGSLPSMSPLRATKTSSNASGLSGRPTLLTSR